MPICISVAAVSVSSSDSVFMKTAVTRLEGWVKFGVLAMATR